jgi:hypothetical protein
MTLYQKIRTSQLNIKKSVGEILLPSDGFYGFAVVVGRQRAIHTENSGFASPTLDQHISTFRGYRILFSIRNV